MKKEEATQQFMQQQKLISGLNLLWVETLGQISLIDKLKTVTDNIVKIFDADFARIWLIKPGDLCSSGCMHAGITEGPHVCKCRDKCLHLMVSSGRYTHINGKVHKRVPFNCYKIGCIASAQDSKLITNDAAHSPSIHNNQWAEELGFVSFAGYRILSSEKQPLGVFALFSKHIISACEDVLLEGVANTIAQIIQTSKAEDALGKTKNHLENILQSSLDCIVVLDKDGKVERANNAFLVLTGFDLHDIIGKPATVFLVDTKGTYQSITGETVRVDDEYMRNVQTAHKALLSEGSVSNRDLYIFNKNGLIIPVEENIALLRDSDNNRIGAVWSIRDMTKRREAEMLLEQSRAFLEKVIDSSIDGIIITDEKGTILSVNAAIEKIMGLNRGEIIGEHSSIIDNSSPVQRKKTRGKMAELFENGYVVYETRHNRKDGKIIYMEFSTTLIKDEKGQYTTGVSILRDITERKKIESQLRHTQKLESLGVLAGGIAHDFNNILMAILGNADLAMSELSPLAPARERILDIEKASRRAADLCRQMLAYSGKGRFVIDVIDLGELIKEMASMLEVTISKKVVLKYNFADNLPAISADATQMRQIIMNLITNASEAIADKSGVVSISVGAMECDRQYLQETYLDEDLKEGVYVYMEVSDTGCGMDKETREKIFEPFFTTKFTGRGLGMAAVLGIVRGHGGAIKVYSEPRKGSSFKLLFPAAEGEAALIKDTTALDENFRGTGTVLVVDDEETVCTVGKLMLEKAGFKVLTASDGKKALEVFLRHKDIIRCVILDFTMPHMDGDETFRELRRIKKDIRVLMSSGYNEQDIISRFAGKGLAGFIQKPYQASELILKMKKILE